MSGFTTVTNSGGQLKLLGLNKRVKDLLQITKLYTVFDVHEEEACGDSQLLRLSGCLEWGGVVELECRGRRATPGSTG